MRRIRKPCILSSVYKSWLDDIELKGGPHPKYSSKHEVYWDVVMNLFQCQGGLCAYTEVTLCSEELYALDRWESGKYVTVSGTPLVKGQLEHFDSQIKANKGWLWENLFMVESDTNHKKSTKIVDPIFKPDASDYNEFEKLQYDSTLHVFTAHSSLAGDLKNRINRMILVLGLNHPTIKHRRRVFLSRILKSIEHGVETWAGASLEVKEFPTAFAMVKNERLEALSGSQRS